MVKRYDRTGCDDLSGSFVKHSDYTSLEAKCAALAAELKQSQIDAGCYKHGMEASNARLSQMAAENAALKQFPEQIIGFIGKLGTSEMGSGTRETIESAAKRIKTPSTDSFLAEVLAQHSESICASLLEKAGEYEARAKEVDCHTTDNRYRFAAAMFRGFAAQLRQEAAR